MHARLSAGVSKGSFALDYGQVLRDHMISPLVKQGADGVGQAVSNIWLKSNRTGIPIG